MNTRFTANRVSLAHRANIGHGFRASAWGQSRCCRVSIVATL